MNDKIRLTLNIFVCIIMVFALTGTTGAVLADRCYTPEYVISQVEKTDTYENAYNSLMKKFSDNYSVSSVPVEVYEKSYTREWMKNSIDEKIRSSFENRDAVTEPSQAKENITGYFEDYAHKAHVIKDEIYENKLAESIEYAEKTAAETADVCSFDAMKRAGITNKLSRYIGIVRKYIMICFAALAVLLIVLILLKRPVYWTGTALFAAGMLLMIPSVYVKVNDMIGKFSLKDYTTYTLVTGTLSSLTDIVLTTGVVMLIAGIIMLAAGIAGNMKKQSPHGNKKQ